MLTAKEKTWDEILNEFVPKDKDSYKKYIDKGDYYLPDKFNVIDLLRIEYETKKKRNFKLKQASFDFISATDLSNFTYCPISFSISKTFEIAKLESAQIGSLQHNKTKLINYVLSNKDNRHYASIEKQLGDDEKKDSTFDNFINEENRNFFSTLKSSEVIFYGHDKFENKTKFFKSSKGNFIGQPDYVFKGSNGDHYIVEEKFQYLPKVYENVVNTLGNDDKVSNKRQPTRFYDNHTIQLLSYIYGISDFDVKFGYLVYWKYFIEGDEPKIISCNVLEIKKTRENREQLIGTYNNLKHLLEHKKASFEISNRSAAKCASCVNNILCGHKTGQFMEYTLPYSMDYLKIKYVEFPAELRKDYEEPSNYEDPRNYNT